MTTHYFNLKKRTLPILCISVLAASILYCVPKKKEEKDTIDFFKEGRFQGDFWKMYPLLPIDTFVKRVAADVEPERHILIAETAYYKLDETRSVSDSTYFRLLDLYDHHFEADTVRWLTQKLRGLCLIDINQLDSAEVCLEDGFAYAQKSKNALRVADVNFELAVLAWRRLNYPEAIDRLLSVYEEFSKLNHVNEKGRMIDILKFMPKVYQSMGDYKDAKKWYQKLWAYVHSQEGKIFETYRVTAAPLLAKNYLSLNQLDSAKIMVNLAFRYQELYKTDDYFKSNRFLIRGKIAVVEGRCADALADCHKAIAYDMFKENVASVSQLNKGLADAYACAEQRDSAIFYYNKALITPDSAFQAEIYAAFSKMYSKTGDYSQALTYEQKSRALHEHTFTIDKENEIGRIEAKHQHDIMLSNLDSQSQKRTWWFIGLLLAVVIGAIVYVVDTLKKRKGYLQEKERIETRERLQAQMLLATKEDLAKKEANLVKQQADLVENQANLVEQQADLAKKEADLAASAQLLESKNALIDALQNKPDTRKRPVYDETLDVDTQQLRRMKILTKEDWFQFRGHFDAAFPHFYGHIQQQYHDLTNAERRLLVLIKVGFDTNDVVHTLGISTESVYKSRYRLRKKLKLSDEIDLETFTQTI